MTSAYSIRIAAFTIAVTMTALVHGTMLWSFDSVAQQATPQSASTAKTQTAAAHQS
jgi:hypothetical protein